MAKICKRQPGIELNWRVWTEEEDAMLRELWVEEIPDNLIAEEMNRTQRAIKQRRGLLNLVKEQPANRKTETFAMEWFPLFEDITKEEARAISANSPPCGRWSRESRTSLTGNSSRMCCNAQNQKM